MTKLGPQIDMTALYSEGPDSTASPIRPRPAVQGAKSRFRATTRHNGIRSLIPQVNPWLGQEEEAAVLRVLRSGWLTEGDVTRSFGERLNELTGAPYGVFAPNGTLALALGLLALGIGPGDEVLVPDITFIGSATAVELVGARPVFVEVEAKTYQIDVASAHARLSAATRAVMPVHLFGSACDMHAIRAFATEKNLYIVEDAAQGIGVHFDGRHVGTIGDIGCFSFFADKTITTGEGGYVTCHDRAVYDRLCHLRNQGRLDRGSFVHQAVGFNFRITDLQAAIGLAQLDRLEAIVVRKRAIDERYRSHLRCLKQVSFLELHRLSDHVPFRTVLIAERAHALMTWLSEQHVQARSFFYPMHRQPCFRDYPDALLTFPNADHGYANGVCLPVHATLSDDDVDYISEAIRAFYEGQS
jgi:perosamine synthetase